MLQTGYIPTAINIFHAKSHAGPAIFHQNWTLNLLYVKIVSEKPQTIAVYCNSFDV